MNAPQPIRRTAEIEELTNRYLIHPLSSRLVPLFARMHVTPNAVSITGMLFGILAGCAYYSYERPRFAIAGFLLMIAWHVMDGADGQLARLTRSQSQFGKVLDGISDNVTFLAVYAALAIALARRFGAVAYVLVAVSAVCHAIQSATYELQRQEYDRWASGKSASAAPAPHAPPAPGASRAPQSPPLFKFLDHLFYERLSFPAAGITRAFRAAMPATLERHPEQAPAIRARYRERFSPLLREWSILSANYRTLGIFITALLKRPEYYFAFEILGFSAILGLLLHRQRTQMALFFSTAMR